MNRHTSDEQVYSPAAKGKTYQGQDISLPEVNEQPARDSDCPPKRLLINNVGTHYALTA